jgi:hypothetical protein
MKVARVSGVRDASRAMAVSRCWLVSILTPTSEAGSYWRESVGAGGGLPQQRLNFFPLPQGQGSLRPTFGAARCGDSEGLPADCVCARLWCAKWR